MRLFKTGSMSSQELLDNVQIASPCPVSWESMSGDDRERFCGKCEKSVYDLSAMTADQAVELIREKQGKMCIQIYRRADGTVQTEDCPSGLKKLRQAMAKKVACAIAAVGWLGISIPASAQTAPANSNAGIQASEPACARTRGEMVARPFKSQPEPQQLGGDIAPDSVIEIVSPLKADNCSDKVMMRWLVGLIAAGASLALFKSLKRKPVWMAAGVVAVIFAAIGMFWL